MENYPLHQFILGALLSYRRISWRAGDYFFHSRLDGKACPYSESHYENPISGLSWEGCRHFSGGSSAWQNFGIYDLWLRLQRRFRFQSKIAMIGACQFASVSLADSRSDYLLLCEYFPLRTNIPGSIYFLQTQETYFHLLWRAAVPVARFLAEGQITYWYFG